MTNVFHLNCGWLHVPPGPWASCHCLLLEESGRLVLVDTGIGLEDIRNPMKRVGPDAIRAAGFQFNEADTAVRQIQRLGFDPHHVTDIVLTHADPDHAGGLSDFPAARVHLSSEELLSLRAGHPRYSPAQFVHDPDWAPHPKGMARWFDLQARELPLGLAAQVFLIELFGHTVGHCGVAVRQGGRDLLHVGDAYYLRIETTVADLPVRELSRLRADDDLARQASLCRICDLSERTAGQVEMFGYHDVDELPVALRNHPA